MRYGTSNWGLSSIGHSFHPHSIYHFPGAAMEDAGLNELVSDSNPYYRWNYMCYLVGSWVWGFRLHIVRVGVSAHRFTKHMLLANLWMTDDGGQAVAFDFTEVQFAVARKAPDGQPGPLLRVRVPST